MNLKLFKSQYKKDKTKSKLDYSLFGDYMKQYKTKLVFTGGFGANTKTTLKLTKQCSQMELYDRQYHLNTIIRHYNIMRKKLYSNEKQSLCSFLTERKRSRSLGRNLIVSHSDEYNKHHPMNSFLLNTTKRYLNIKNKHNNKSALQATTTLIFNRHSNIKKNLNKYQSSIDTKSGDNNDHNRNTNGKLTKYDETIFSKKKKGLNNCDQNCIMEKLKQEFKFYIKDHESDYEREKWKMFKKKDGVTMRFVSKYSLNWIKLMNRKAS